ncbi:MAG: hypothetical protein JNK55_00385 [Rubrivivax sp.]|nr:hypothetical protein [Rubrivivax sp.]
MPHARPPTVRREESDARKLAMADGLLVVVTLVMRCRDLKSVAPRSASSLRVLWFPALFLLRTVRNDTRLSTD